MKTRYQTMQKKRNNKKNKRRFIFAVVLALLSVILTGTYLFSSYIVNKFPITNKKSLFYSFKEINYSSFFGLLLVFMIFTTTIGQAINSVIFSYNQNRNFSKPIDLDSIFKSRIFLYSVFLLPFIFASLLTLTSEQFQNISIVIAIVGVTIRLVNPKGMSISDIMKMIRNWDIH